MHGLGVRVLEWGLQMGVDECHVSTRGQTRGNRHVSLNRPRFLEIFPKNSQGIYQYQNPFENRIPKYLDKSMINQDYLTPEHLPKIRQSSV